MASLLDKIRSGTTGLFSGPMLPGQDASGGSPDPGARQGLISAGLATIIAANQGANTMEALAMGAMQGREAGAVARQDFANRQARAQLAKMLEAEGYDRDNLTSAAFQLLSAGDLDGAKGVFNILQSLPNPARDAGINTRNVEMTAEEIRRQGGTVPEGAKDSDVYLVPEDPRSLQRFYSRATRKPPEEQSEFNMYDPNSPTGQMRVRVVDGAIIPIAPAGMPEDGSGPGSKTFTERINDNLARVAGASNAMLEPYQNLLASIPVGMMNSRNAVIAYLGRKLASQEEQIANTYRAGVLNPTVRWLSGAQMNMDEARRYDNMLFLQPGEDPDGEVAKAKARMRAVLIAAMGDSEQFPPYEYDPTLSNEENKRRAIAHTDTVMEQVQNEALAASWNPFEPLPEDDLGVFGSVVPKR